AATQTINATTANNPITVTVTDANNCTATSTETITEYLLNATTTQTDLTCNSVNTGVIDLTVTNGTSPFTYSWTGPGTFTANTEDIANLTLGTYNVTVTDANSCTWTGNATVIEDILNSNWPVVIPNTNGDEQIYDMAYDEQGNIYVIGLFNDNITLPDINNIPVTYYSTSSDVSIFVAKYDYCGNCINGHAYGTIASTVLGTLDCHIEYLSSVSKVAVTGPFTSVDFTDPPFTGNEMTASSGGVFLAFLDPTTLYCTTTQEISLISTQAVYVKGLSLNGNSAFITGIFSDYILTVSPSMGILYNTNTQACCPHDDIFMARFDFVSNDLQFAWSKSYTQSISNDQGMATEWAGASDIYFTYKRDQESYIVKINASDGSWVMGSEEKIGIGSEYFEINDMASYNGKLYLCGFENTPPNSNRAAVIFYPNLPTIDWNPTDAIPVISFPSSGNNKNTANKIVANSNGIYVAGTFGIDQFSLDPMNNATPLTLYGSPPTANHFVTKFNPTTFAFQWQTGVMSNTIGTSRATSLVYDSDRDMYYIGGSFDGIVQLNNIAGQTMSTNTGNDAFIARFEDLNAAAYYKIFALNKDTLSNNNSQSLELFPNPTNGKVVITSIANDVFNRIAITDVTGCKVYEKSFADVIFKTEIDLSFLPSNTYIVTVNTLNNVYNRKLVIIK
ncbi:MAG: T9SS type A sorting domain-containing protein, partial [Candidatus Aquicultor sp.]